MDTFFFNLVQRGYQAVKRCTRRMGAKGVFSVHLRLIIVPLLVRQAHWTFACIHMDERRIAYQDSYGSPPPPGLLDELHRWLQQECIQKTGNTLPPFEVAIASTETRCRQRNGFDCGVCALLCLSRLEASAPNDDVRQENMPSFRIHIAAELADFMHDACGYKSNFASLVYGEGHHPTPTSPPPAQQPQPMPPSPTVPPSLPTPRPPPRPAPPSPPQPPRPLMPALPLRTPAATLSAAARMLPPPNTNMCSHLPMVPNYPYCPWPQPLFPFSFSNSYAPIPGAPIIPGAPMTLFLRPPIWAPFTPHLPQPTSYQHSMARPMAPPMRAQAQSQALELEGETHRGENADDAGDDDDADDGADRHCTSLMDMHSSSLQALDQVCLLSLLQPRAFVYLHSMIRCM
mmetsp:Transcript_44403/g.101785  ORF Transcript_44403/g.101785 Transcript_44403/m.101785 type:complete len:401 (+) Transcript_44403:539-1741(+)